MNTSTADSESSARIGCTVDLDVVRSWLGTAESPDGSTTIRQRLELDRWFRDGEVPGYVVAELVEAAARDEILTVPGYYLEAHYRPGDLDTYGYGDVLVIARSEHGPALATDPVNELSFVTDLTGVDAAVAAIAVMAGAIDHVLARYHDALTAAAAAADLQRGHTGSSEHSAAPADSAVDVHGRPQPFAALTIPPGPGPATPIPAAAIGAVRSRPGAR